jgi:transposase
VDGLGRLVAFNITPGQRGDAPVAGDLIALLPASATLAADRAYDSDALRCLLIARGTMPVIPNGPRRKNLHPFDRTAYKRRNLVERAFCRIKDFRRIATRYDKLAATYAAAISKAIDDWRFDKRIATRAEAIRQLIALGLQAKSRRPHH